MTEGQTHALDPDLLHSVERKPGGKIIAQCPACAEADGDTGGNHLIVFPSGKYACVAHQGESGREHRRRIFEIAGIPINKQHDEDRETREKRMREAEQQRTKERERRTAIERAAGLRETIIERFTWDFPDVWSKSPVSINPWPDQWRQLLAKLFGPYDIVWIGDQYDSGKKRHMAHFKSANEWDALETPTGTRITTGLYEAGEYRRQKDRVTAQPFIVIEADEAIGKKPETEDEIRANRAANLAIIRWCRDACGMELRAIIDSGNKSFHAWFQHPGEKAVRDLDKVAVGLGIDDAFANPVQPWRLPNVTHEQSGRKSQLVWLAK